MFGSRLPCVFGSTLRCVRCGSSSISHGLENVSTNMRPFVRGDIVSVIKPMGICGECYAVLCSDCAIKGRCSVCGSPFPLLAECPSTPPPWWKLFKRLKWTRVFYSQFY